MAGLTFCDAVFVHADNDASSIIVVVGTAEDAKAAQNAVEEDHANAIKREAHELTAETFNSYIEDPANKMVVRKFIVLEQNPD